MNKGLRTTVIGGIIFLVPLVFILIILNKAYGFAFKIAKPISKVIPIETLGGVALANILAGLAVFLVCYGAGVMARSSIIAAQVEKLDHFLTRAIPTYHSTKRGFIDSIDDTSIEDNWQAVLIGEPSGQRTLGFETERLSNGDSVVFQPNSPNTRNGTVMTVPRSQIERIDIAPRDMSAVLKSYGAGASKKL
ncbi:hypothetical protein [uncultured Pelagimonas sp.]|uniref:hypothetical protein n=1 Tax=uncultured Pelagimonas sp. TaxID=1618102 RepID=UPI00260D07DB|nr:hypothetical protein [uncultured Pelagimonas sp.]